MGQVLEVGEVFHLRNGLHDDKLLEHRYVVLVEDDVTRKGFVTCIGCSKVFANEPYRNAHAINVQHDTIVVDGPQLKQPAKAFDPVAGGADRPLEPDGAPAPTPMELTGAGPGAPGRKGKGSQAQEVFRLG